MLGFDVQTLKSTKQIVFFRFKLRLFFGAVFVSLAFAAVHIFQNVSAQEIAVKPQTPASFFRVGERLTYSISFNKFDNAAYAEIYSVSRGKLGERDAVELRARIKTVDLVSSAFYALDEARATFASPETNLPLYVRKTSNAGITPKETVYNYLVNPTGANDLLTLIYQIRNAGGVGAFAFQEDDKSYSINLQNTVGERVKTDAGEFDTVISTAQSQYFTDKGITDVRVNFSTDEARVPVLIRFKTAKGNFRAALASRQLIEPETAPAPTPAPVASPAPQRTPTPAPTPTPYVENQPLLADLPFALGETLEYQVSNAGGKYFGNVTVQARERRQFNGLDSLLLTATATATEAGNPLFNLNDAIRAQVNPDTLEPRQIELNFAGANAVYNQTALFDQKNGFVTFDGAKKEFVPVGTHSLLSLVYAVRSFNLKPSKDATNPVNDTRVAVFVGSQAYVFTLRPSAAEIINLKGEKISAQLVSISTGNSSFDQLNVRLWLGTDEKRLPLRLVAGNYQADLISESKVAPK